MAPSEQASFAVCVLSITASMEDMQKELEKFKAGRLKMQKSI